MACLRVVSWHLKSHDDTATPCEQYNGSPKDARLKAESRRLLDIPYYASHPQAHRRTGDGVAGVVATLADAVGDGSIPTIILLQQVDVLTGAEIRHVGLPQLAARAGGLWLMKHTVTRRTCDANQHEYGTAVIWCATQCQFDRQEVPPDTRDATVNIFWVNSMAAQIAIVNVRLYIAKVQRDTDRNRAIIKTLLETARMCRVLIMGDFNTPRALMPQTLDDVQVGRDFRPVDSDTVNPTSHKTTHFNDVVDWVVADAYVRQDWELTVSGYMEKDQLADISKLPCAERGIYSDHLPICATLHNRYTDVVEPQQSV